MNETPSFKWASCVVRTLYSEGVTTAVISPGSRNTSLTLALAMHLGIRCYSAIDERSAAFIALGISKISRIPTLLCCTSGTAGANYYPAVIEAYESSVPLLIATADRPASLQQVGASQTIDQHELFGSFVLDYQQLPEAEDLRVEGDWSAAIKQVSHAARCALQGGPVHVNIPFRKPFEPTDQQRIEYAELTKQEFSSQDTHETSETVDSAASHFRSSNSFRENAHAQARHISSEEFIHWYASLQKPMIVVGAEPTPMQWKQILPKLLEHPNARIITETGASVFGWNFDESSLVQSRMVAGWKSILTTQNAPSSEIDGIIRMGKEAISPELQHWLLNCKNASHVRCQTHESFENSQHLPCRFWSPEQQKQWLTMSSPELQWPKYSQKWHQDWKDLELLQLEKNRTYFQSNSKLTDGAVMHALGAILPPEVFVFFSNSFPVRDQELFRPGWSKTHQLISQRGAAGIDGISSTAIGVSLALKRPGVVLTGDISFLYDSNSLLSGRILSHPLLIIVFNNGGGSIFKMLPVYTSEPEHIAWFQTPQQVQIQDLARAHGISYKGVTSLEELSNPSLSHWIHESLDFTANIIDDKGSQNLRILEFFTDDESSIHERTILGAGGFT